MCQLNRPVTFSLDIGDMNKMATGDFVMLTQYNILLTFSHDLPYQRSIFVTNVCDYVNMISNTIAVTLVTVTFNCADT